MDEIICPSCGKSNPAEATSCQYCQEPLEPAIIFPQDEDSPIVDDSLFSTPEENNQEVEWLSSLRTERDDETPPLHEDQVFDSQEPEPEAEAKDPEWLLRIREREALNKPPEPQPIKGETPDWIKKIRQKTGRDVDSPPTSGPIMTDKDPADQTANLTQWSDDSLENQPGKMETPIQKADIPTGNQTGVQGAAAKSGQNPPPQSGVTNGDLDLGWNISNDDIIRFSSQDYSWLEAIKEAGPAPADNDGLFMDEDPVSESGSASLSHAGLEHPLSEDSLPSWLTDPLIGGQNGVEPALEGSTTNPDGLSVSDEEDIDGLIHHPDRRQAKADQEMGKQSNRSREAEKGRDSDAFPLPISSPAWMDDESRVEMDGPLAGIRSAIPSESPTIPQQRPAVYSGTLIVNDRQQGQATLLENLMSDNRRPVTPARKNRKVSAVPRLVIGLLLLFTVGAFLFTGGGGNLQAGFSNMPGAGSKEFANTVEALQPNDTVLLAVDYQPGFDGELRTASQALVQRLIEKKIKIILVSTLPSGAAIGEDLLLNQPYKEFSSENLGYLPGGQSSLQAFALDMRQAAPAGYRETANVLYYVGLLDKLAISPVWRTEVLKEIHSLQQTAAVFVATDSADTARVWIEQVQPLLGGKPMLIIASAQAAPMLEPYVASGQVKGMLSGFKDGLAYQAYLQQAGPDRQSGLLAAYTMGAGFAVLCAIIGGILSLLQLIYKQNKRKARGGRL